MNGSWVTANTAGIESTANIMSLASTTDQHQQQRRRVRLPACTDVKRSTVDTRSPTAPRAEKGAPPDSAPGATASSR